MNAIKYDIEENANNTARLEKYAQEILKRTSENSQKNDEGGKAK